jgi:predicted kinase
VPKSPCSWTDKNRDELRFGLRSSAIVGYDVRHNNLNGDPDKNMNTSAKLIALCGKMASGKSTLARDLAIRENAVLLAQDDFLNALFPGEITDIPAFLDRYARLKNALTPHICVLLSKRISVVLDFAAATKTQRAWFRELIERTHVEHELHFVDAPDAACKTQLRDRSRGLPAGTRWTTEEDFEAINAYFQPPSEDEKFNVVRHERV